MTENLIEFCICKGLKLLLTFPAMIKSEELVIKEKADQKFKTSRCLKTFSSKTFKKHKKCKERRQKGETDSKAKSGAGDNLQEFQTDANLPSTSSDLSEADTDLWINADHHDAESDSKTEPFPEYSLSQKTPNYGTINIEQESTNEREIIEEKIKSKYQEIKELTSQLRTAKRSRRLHRKYSLRKHDKDLICDDDCDTQHYVNICPIKRRRRSAQPIRNAVLIRSTIKKTWKGVLGSCCGQGCWAKWQWVDLNIVMSDYE